MELKRASTLAALALSVAACGTATPTSPPPAASPTAASPSVAPSSPAPSAAGLELRVGDWTATCSDVPEDECQGVAALFANNLARSWMVVFEASGGRIEVTNRSACPALLPDWADPASCWQATAGTEPGQVCMVIGRWPRPEGAALRFGQVGGDDMAGRAGAPPSGWPACD